MSIFDDRDPSWTYTGDWAKVSESPALDETVHLSAGTGEIAEFSFSGGCVAQNCESAQRPLNRRL